MSPSTPQWIYDAGEHRTKHCSKEKNAHFVTGGTAVIGKCPADLTREVAQQLLNEGIAYFRPQQPYPAKIYNLHKGVVYEAVPTLPGQSYHGYPWKKMPGRNILPDRIIRQLNEKAIANGCLDDFQKWMKQYG